MFRIKLSVNNQETAESKGFVVEIGNSRHIFWIDEIYNATLSFYY